MAKAFSLNSEGKKVFCATVRAWHGLSAEIVVFNHHPVLSEDEGDKEEAFKG